jgi:hypothetical protein
MVAAIPHQFALLRSATKSASRLFRPRPLVSREFFEIIFHKALISFKQFLQALVDGANG